MAVPGRTLSSMSWTAAGQVATTAINFGVSVALARLLAPHDFGVVALAVGLQIVLGALTDFGLAALVIRADLPRAQLNGLFRLRLAVGAVQALIGHDSISVRSSAVRALAAIDPGNPDVIPAAAALLDTEGSWSAYSDAAHVLAAYGPEAAAALPRLRELMSHHFDWMRIAAAEAVWAVSGDTETTVPVLVTAWEQNPATARAAAPVLARMGAAAAPAVALARAELDAVRRNGFRKATEDRTVLEHARTIVAQAAEA